MISVKEYNDNFLRELSRLLENSETKQKFEFYNDRYYKRRIERENIFSYTEFLLLDFILAHLPGKKILEIGCGVGQLSIFLKLRGIDIEACEVHEPRFYLASKIKTFFRSDVTIYNKKFQDLDLDKYDVLCGGDIISDYCNFKEDKVILDNFTKENKFILIDGDQYGLENKTIKDEIKSEYFNKQRLKAIKHFYYFK